MDRACKPRYGRFGSTQGVDAASSLVGGLTIRASQARRRLSPVILASESEFPHIAESIKAMSDKHNDVLKQRLQLPLKTAFIDTMRSAGFPEPRISDEYLGGFYKVTIHMDVASNAIVVQGELCTTVELAETSAIEQALVKLKRDRNVVLVDISARKNKAAISYGRTHYLKGCDGLLYIGVMIKQWWRCLDDIESVIGFTEENLQTGNKVQRGFADAVHTSLLIIKGRSRIQVGDIDGRITELRAEKDKYVAASRAEPFFLPHFPKNKTCYHNVDALAVVLQKLNLPECVYSLQPDSNGLYLGAAQLTFPNNQKTIIWANQHKRTIAKANNAAAMEAILFLEERYKIDVAGYDHDASRSADQETFVWKGLYDEIFNLADDVLLCWGDLIKEMGDNMERYRMERCRLAQRDKVGSEMHFINDLVGRIELSCGKCVEFFTAARTKLDSLK